MSRETGYFTPLKGVLLLSELRRYSQRSLGSPLGSIESPSIPKLGQSTLGHRILLDSTETFRTTDACLQVVHSAEMLRRFARFNETKGWAQQPSFAGNQSLIDEPRTVTVDDLKTLCLQLLSRQKPYNIGLCQLLEMTRNL